MLSKGKQNTVPASFQSYLVSMPTQPLLHNVTVASHPTSHCAQLSLRPHQSVSVVSTSEPLSSGVNVLTASSGMCQVFSTRTQVPSFLLYRMPTSSQVNLVCVSEVKFSEFPVNVQNFRFLLFGGLANHSTVIPSLSPVHSELGNLLAKKILYHPLD